MHNRYEIVIHWSDEDDCFIAEVPELSGCMADGATYQETVTNAELAMRSWVETANQLGRAVPKHKGRLLYA